MISFLLFLFIFLFMFMVMFNDLMMFSYVLIVSLIIMILFGYGYVGVIGFKDGYMFMLDSYSYMMIMLTLWMVFLSYFLLSLSFWGFLLFVLVLFSLVMSFVSSSIYMYYIFFEFSLIPMFLLILGLGTTQDRLLAGLYMFIYTMVSSMPFFFIIMLIGSGEGFLGFDIYYYGFYSLEDFYILVFVVFFMVKIPIFMFHIWLPKAHVEAPVYGSMILASVMLKLGGYGFIRLMDMVDFKFLGDYVISLSIFGMIVMGLSCFYITDMKVLVAYSSVIHMCLMMCGFFSFNMVGFMGGYIMMISHGICSSGLFMMVNYMYERSYSRLMIFNKGFMGVFPMFSFFWLMMIMGNIGAPPTLSMLGEIYCLIGLFSYCWYGFLFLVLGLFFISSYFMNLYSMIFGSWEGPLFNGMFIKDYFMVFYHLFPLNFIIFFVSCIF